MKRGGDPFETVRRVDSETKKCPEGTEPCSEDTSPENTVCYPKDQHSEACPITEILFVDSIQEVYKYQSLDTSVTVKPFLYEDSKGSKSNMYLVYSKKKDNMPIIATTVEENNPCADPVSEANYYYPLEKDRMRRKCVSDAFSETGGEVNEYEV